MAKSILERLKKLEDLYKCICNSSSGGTGSQTLRQTLGFGNETDGRDIIINDADAIELQNTSLLKKGTYNFGGNGGISRICSNNYEDMWQNGFRHVFDQSGFIRHSTNCFNIIPDANFDVTLRFAVGSFWTLDNGTTYVCTDNTEGAAVWELYSSPASKYKVFTALLSQSGGDNPIQTSGDEGIIKGVTYTIAYNPDNIDISSIGAPNNNVGTIFVSTRDASGEFSPTIKLDSNTGAPTAIVLENNIGNIWFNYFATGEYNVESGGLFLTNKSTIIVGNPYWETGNGYIRSGFDSEDYAIIRTLDFNNDPTNDNILIRTMIEIRVYN